MRVAADFNLMLSPGAVIDVERGKEDLGKAGKFKKAALKKKVLCIGILVVAVIIILLSKSTLPALFGNRYEQKHFHKIEAKEFKLYT